MSANSELSPQQLVTGANDAVVNGDYDTARDLFHAAIRLLTDQLGAEHEEVISLREDLITLDEMESMKEFASEVGDDRGYHPSQITHHTPHGTTSENQD